jgi:hypothetical protein
MADYLKSQTPQELWKARLEPPDPLKPTEPFDPKPLASAGAQPLPAAKAPGTGVLLDTTA